MIRNIKKIEHLVTLTTAAVMIFVSIFNIKWLLALLLFIYFIEIGIFGFVQKEVLFTRGSSYKYGEGEKFGQIMNGFLLGIGVIGEVITLIYLFIQVVNYFLR